MTHYEKLQDTFKKRTQTGAGKTEWRLSTITTILKNEKYMGDMLQQKTISIDYLSHTRVKNKKSCTYLLYRKQS